MNILQAYLDLSCGQSGAGGVELREKNFGKMAYQ